MKRHRLLLTLALFVFAASATSSGAAPSAQTQLARPSLLPRTPIDAGEPVAAPRPVSLASDAAFGHRLVVKFRDDVRARVRPSDGGLASESGTSVAAANRLAREEGLRFAPLLRLDDAKLAGLEQRARTLSGREQPDLRGMLVVEGGALAGTADLERVGRALRALEVVEFVYVQSIGVPPPGDIAPTTPNLVGQQSYLGSNPGFEISWARAQGYRGGSVRFSDCEYGWNGAHEDLNDISIHPEPGQTVAPGVFANGWDSHGTAVVGGSSAVDNAYGITGIADEASVHTYTEWSVEDGPRRATAIANAIADSSFGDVVLLEMQTTGAGGGFGPAELDPTVFAIVKAGADAGVVVVAAAGNGNQNLDSAAYASYRARGDSGSILVGAGTPNTSHSKQSFSTYGSRVDVQGWGSSVFTLGYGDFAQYGGDKNQRYTAFFSGTSSASGLVAPVCVLLQDAAETTTGARLSPRALRELLKSTGLPQGSGGNIGTFPDLRAAIEALPTFTFADFEASGRFGDAPLSVTFQDQSAGATGWAWDFGDGGSSSSENPTHVYTTPGVYDVTLTVSGPGGSNGVTRSGYVVVDEALAITAVNPVAIPALQPGTGKDVTIEGVDFTPSTTVALDGVLLDPASYLFVDDTTIELDMPQLTSLGAHTLTLTDAGVSVDETLTVVAPETPVLQIGNGDALNNNSIPSKVGANVTVAGQVGERHYVLYSSVDGPSVVPGLVSLSIGDGFTDLGLVGEYLVGGAGWSEVNVPFTPTFALFYFQSFTLDQGRPLAVSNLQSAILLP